MAINFVVSYTFSPSTTISSSQVNTNFSDEANVWTGLEALTKSFAKLKVDGDPSTALEVATKQYVDHYSIWRRPVLQYASGTVVNMETGIDGTSGEARILFPDGSVRTDSTSGRINCNLAQVAALSGAWQSGLRTGTVANNTWYAIYAVKTTDDTAKFVAVADTVLPVQGSFSTLNSNFGSNSWVYLGLVRNGDGGGTATGILNFFQTGNVTYLQNQLTGNNVGTTVGFLLATTSNATSLTWTYSAGTSGAVLPSILGIANWLLGGGQLTIVLDGPRALTIGQTFQAGTEGAGVIQVQWIASKGISFNNRNASTGDIILMGWQDNVLGVGSNPLL